MSFKMQPAIFPHGGWPEGDDLPPASAATYPKGAPLTIDGSQTLAERAVSETTAYVGVSLEGVTAGDADNPSGTVNYAHAGRSSYFVAKVVDNTGAVQTVTTALINTNRPLRKQGTGRDAWWGVRNDTTTGAVVKITGIDVDRNVAFFKFLEAAIQVV